MVSNNPFNRRGNSGGTSNRPAGLAVGTFAYPDEFMIAIDATEVDVDKLSLTVRNGNLRITTNNTAYRGRGTATRRRSTYNVNLPENVDIDSKTTVVNNNVLTVRFEYV
jgi:HSP20 family molecular chaperone IbpA